MAAAARCLRSFSRSSTSLKVSKLDVSFDPFNVNVKANRNIFVAVIFLHLEEYPTK